ENIRAGFEVLAVNRRDELRPREHEEVVVPLDVAAVVAKALAAKRLFVELLALDHGAHRTVEQHDALFESLLQLRDAFLPLAFVDGRNAERRRGGTRDGTFQRARRLGLRGCVSVRMRADAVITGIHATALPATRVPSTGGGRGANSAPPGR